MVHRRVSRSCGPDLLEKIAAEVSGVVGDCARGGIYRGSERKKPDSIDRSSVGRGLLLLLGTTITNGEEWAKSSGEENVRGECVQWGGGRKPEPKCDGAGSRSRSLPLARGEILVRVSNFDGRLALRTCHHRGAWSFSPCVWCARFLPGVR